MKRAFFFVGSNLNTNYTYRLYRYIVMTTLKCARHNLEISIDKFSINSKTNDYYKQCDDCRNKMKEWREKNKEKDRASKLKSYHKLKNGDRFIEYKEKTKGHRLEYYKEYNANRKDKMSEYNRKWKENNRVEARLRDRVRRSIKEVKGYKFNRFWDLLGCSIKELYEWFYYQMNNRNIDIKDYHIDHFIPCKSFDLAKKEEQLKCFHWTNLQLLIANENISKKDKIPDKITIENRNKIIDAYKLLLTKSKDQM